MARKKTSGSFVKGDPRCWKLGRPKSFKDLRTLAKSIAEEKATVKGSPLVDDGHAVTVVEAIFRGWATDKKKQQ